MEKGGNGATPAAKIVPAVRQCTVLVIEDEPDTRAIICHTLSALGHSILEAEDGQRAMELCCKALPDLIITDVMMPHVDGNQFVRWFREQYPDRFVPILMLTALGHIDQKIDGLDIGADDYLTKPFNYRELQARSQALLRIKQLTERLHRRNSDLELLNKELSRMQEELIKKERQLVAAQLAGAASHNLGQPITTIVLNCRVLEKAMRQGIPKDDARVRHAVDAIKAECEALHDLLDRLSEADPSLTQRYVGSTTILDI